MPNRSLPGRLRRTPDTDASAGPTLTTPRDRVPARPGSGAARFRHDQVPTRPTQRTTVQYPGGKGREKTGHGIARRNGHGPHAAATSMRFAAAISLRCCASYTRIQAPHMPNSLDQPDSIVQPSQTSSQSSNGADWSPNPHHPRNTPPPTPNQCMTLYAHARRVGPIYFRPFIQGELYAHARRVGPQLPPSTRRPPTAHRSVARAFCFLPHDRRLLSQSSRKLTPSPAVWYR